MRLRRVCDEELAAVGAGAGIGHRDNSRFVFQGIPLEFIFELIARPAPSGPGRVTALDHEVADYAVENNSAVKNFLNKENEVVDRFWRKLRIKRKLDVTPVGCDGDLVVFVRIDLHIRWIVPLFVCHFVFLQNDYKRFIGKAEALWGDPKGLYGGTTNTVMQFFKGTTYIQKN